MYLEVHTVAKVQYFHRNVKFSFARVIVTTQTIIGNGKLCILISLEVLGMTHPSPGSFSYGKMGSWLIERPTMLTTYIQP